METISRKQAKEQGLTRYFTGLPCKRGHISPRDVCNHTCVECKKEAQNRAYKENPEPQKKKTNHRYWSNPEASRKAFREAYQFRKDKVIRDKQVWRENNREHVRKKGIEYAANRRARLLGLDGNISTSEVQNILQLQKNRCANCRSKIKNNGYEVDHITPVSKGGTNDIGNIQILCVSCNRSKSAKMPEEWAFYNGRLI